MEKKKRPARIQVHSAIKWITSLSQDYIVSNKNKPWAFASFSFDFRISFTFSYFPEKGWKIPGYHDGGLSFDLFIYLEGSSLVN